MDVEKIFVGRKAELDQFKAILEDTKGEAGFNLTEIMDLVHCN